MTLEPTAKRNKALRAGVIVLVILGVLTAAEFAVAAFSSALWIPLILIALVKAFFVLRDYMHLPRLFANDEGEQH
jgi:hypothetical protein